MLQGNFKLKKEKNNILIFVRFLRKLLTNYDIKKYI